MDKLKQLGISVVLYKCYVDDIILALNGIERGWAYSKREKKLVYNPDTANDEICEDVNTFNILRDIANNIYVNIQMEIDVPSYHENGHLPVLDLNMFVSNDEIEYSFFKKPVTSLFQIMYRSALNTQTKRASLLQEGVRRFRNTSDCISYAEKAQILTKFMWSLKISGFDHKYRHRTP